MQPNLNTILEQVGKDKGIDKEILVATLEAAILTAAKKTFGPNREIEAQFSEEKGTVELFQIVTVAEEVLNPFREISLEDAERRGLDAEMGDELLFQIFYRDEDEEKAKEQDRLYGDLLNLKMHRRGFGRIAAQTAKQVIIQRVREAERENIYNEYKDRKGELVTGLVRRFERGNIIVDLGRTEAILHAKEQAPRESYRPGDHIQAYMIKVEKSSKGPQIQLSRTHPGLLIKLFENEVPEIYEGIVTIESAAREPGSRSKIAVSSSDSDVDPVGACVGMKGSRVQAVVQELRGEKIDIVPWDYDTAKFVCNAISPAEVTKVIIDEDNNSMELIVPDDQLSLAIGRRGQNVRLAAQLTGWHIDIHSESKIKEMMERAYDSMRRIEALDPDMVPILYRHGFRGTRDIADSEVEDLMVVPGFSEERCRGLIESAKVAYEREKEEELEKLRQERLLRVKGVGERTLASLEGIGLKTVEDLAAAEPESLTQNLLLPLERSDILKDNARRYLEKERAGITDFKKDIAVGDEEGIDLATPPGEEEPLEPPQGEEDEVPRKESL